MLLLPYTAHHLQWILHLFTPTTFKNLITEQILQSDIVVSVNDIFQIQVIRSCWNFYHWLVATSSFSHNDECTSVIRCGEKKWSYFLGDLRTLSHLVQRSFFITYGSATSFSNPLQAGVTQRSVSGTVQYILYTTNIQSTHSMKVEKDMFSDGTAVLASSTQYTAGTSQLQEAVTCGYVPEQMVKLQKVC